jgi:glucose/arabinose dehydrogenase
VVPSGKPTDVLTGFVDDHGDAWGRPVGVAIDKRGSLLVADDVGNALWRLTGSPEPSPRSEAHR